MNHDDWKVDVPVGKSNGVEVKKFMVEENSITNWRLVFQGRGATQGEHTMMLRNGELWMSDTIAEALDHYECQQWMQLLGGRVLVVGLGLGMIVKQALALPNVTHVDVVEIDPDVIALVGPTYAGPQCTIHQADIYELKWPPNTSWSVAWFDIWPTITSDNIPEMTRLARSYGKRTGWQGYWAKKDCQKLLREEKRWERMWM